MIVLFLIGFLWIPSVLGGCTKVAGDCQDGSCSDSCYVWRGPFDGPSHCSIDGLSYFITTTGVSGCKEVLGRPKYANEDWNYFTDSITLGTTCEIGHDGLSKGSICKCDDSPHCLEPPPKTKSKLSTEAIIGITLGTLLIISIIIFIFRNQLPFRFAKQTGQQLLQ